MKLSVKLLKEGRNRRFDPSFENFYIKNLLAYRVSEHV